MECMSLLIRTGKLAASLRAGLAMALLGLATSPWEAGAQPQAQQGAVARLKNVVGNVLVSRESGLSAGGQAERLVNGTRIITTANSEAVIEFDNGCEVRMKENERFDVDSTRACALLAAQPLGPAAAAASSSLAGLVLPIGVGSVVLAGSDAIFPSGVVVTPVGPVSPN